MRTHRIAVILSFACALLPWATTLKAQNPSTPAQPKPAARPAQPPAASQPGALGTPSAAPSPFKNETEKLSYALGMNLGIGFHQQALEVDPKLILQGVQDGLAGGKTLLTEQEMVATLQQFQSELRSKSEERRRGLAETNLKEGEAFLAANKLKEGVVTLPSGLQYKVITEGTGPKPGPEDTVVCHYRGTLINGVEFDSSYRRGQPTSFKVNEVIAGWTEALQLMHVGSKWQLVVPSNLAYGPQGRGETIGPNTVLVFDVELISIRGKW